MLSRLVMREVEKKLKLYWRERSPVHAIIGQRLKRHRRLCAPGREAICKRKVDEKTIKYWLMDNNSFGWVGVATKTMF